MTLDIKSATAFLSESSMACETPEAPRPFKIEERIGVSPLVRKSPRAFRMPVDVEEPLSVRLGSEGKGILGSADNEGSGSVDVIALPAEARTVPSTEVADAR